jgi:ABC-type multidrug transport system fused ATPase/permease subunit
MIVAGEIGSGKTTLLYSILNETVKTEGTLNVRGTIAYVEQDPFIISGSIEKNITFGLEFNEEWFDHVLNASALDRDMPSFNKGRHTMIGERGVNISGGQKTRISLARAIYKNADIYLLDDPLSAVDPEVANIIFE